MDLHIGKLVLVDIREAYDVDKLNGLPDNIFQGDVAHLLALRHLGHQLIDADHIDIVHHISSVLFRKS